MSSFFEKIAQEPLNDINHIEVGDILIAEPFLSDSNFSRSVILVCEHKDEEGTFGLILNKPTMISVDEAAEGIFCKDTMFVGGPVEQNTMHFIHTFEDLEEGILIKDGIYWGGDYEELKSKSVEGQVNHRNNRFFMGYSGWGQTQLQGELQQNSWVIARTDLSMVLTVSPENLWYYILSTMGGKYRVFANYPTDPRLN